MKARQPGRRKKQPDTQREGPVKPKNWARTPHGSNRGGEGGNHKPPKAAQQRAQVQKGRHTEASEKTQAEQKADNQAKRDKQQRHTQKDPSKNRTRNHPEGEESTATKGRQTGGGSEKGQAKRPPQSLRAGEGRTSSGTQGNIAQGTKQGETTAGRSKEGEKTKKGGNRYVILRVVYSR